MLLAQPAQRVGERGAGHRDVEQHDVGDRLAQRVQRVLSIRRLTGHGDRRIVLGDAPQAGANDRMIVHDEDANHWM
jgi:hypothetical protein